MPNVIEETKIGKAMTEDVHKDIKKNLAKKYHCYVLITCDEPDETGHMNVNMSYEGDVSLASYLVSGAQEYFDANEESDLVH